MLLLASLAVAFEEPPVTEVTTVAFNRRGDRVAIETRWVDEGPGFPIARVELRDTADNRVLGAWTARLDEPRAGEGFAGAIREARQQAAGALEAAGVDLGRPAVAQPCHDGACGPDEAGAGCARGRDRVRVTVTSTPTDQEVAQCHGRGRPHLLSVSAQGNVLLAEKVPADGCPSAYRADSAWLQGESIVVLLAHAAPGHEGTLPQWRVVAGRTRP